LAAIRYAEFADKKEDFDKILEKEAEDKIEDGVVDFAGSLLSTAVPFAGILLNILKGTLDKEKDLAEARKKKEENLALIRSEIKKEIWRYDLMKSN